MIIMDMKRKQVREPECRRGAYIFYLRARVCRSRLVLFFFCFTPHFFNITFCLSFRLPLTFQCSLLRVCVNIFLYFLTVDIRNELHIRFLLLLSNTPWIYRLSRYVKINHHHHHLFENIFSSFYFKGNGFCPSLIDQKKEAKKRKTSFSYFYWIFFSCSFIL